MKNQVTKRELLFLYESKFSIPNGDPFTNEQRYDEATKKILVSDVRIKRFIRDYLEDNGELIYVSDIHGKVTSKDRLIVLYDKNETITSIIDLLTQCIDVRLFGGISTFKDNEAKKLNLTDAHTSLTGPVQFALLNPSLNKVNLRIHQNTTRFKSKDKNEQGSIGTTSIVPYSLNQILGWVNPYSAEETRLAECDVKKMLEAMWKSINLSNTRSKSNQRSVLLLSINYKETDDKIYGIDQAILLESKEKEEEDIRTLEDYNLDFTKLFDLVKSEKVGEVEFFTEIDEIKEKLISKDKFKFVEYIS